MVSIKQLPRPLKIFVFFNLIQLNFLIFLFVVSYLYESINITHNVKSFCKVTCVFSILLHAIRTRYLKVEEVATKSRKTLVILISTTISI